MTAHASGRGPADHPLLPELLLRTAAERPDDPAVISGDERLTFAELVRRSRGLAGHLRGLGVTADQCVGLFVEPSTEVLTGAWAILLAGGAYLPLAPEYPEERLRFMIEHSGVKVIVAQDRLVERLTALAPAGTVVVRAEDDHPSAPVAPGAVAPGADGPDPDPDPGALAYVIYTSGSTGRPKGVMIEHRSIAHQMAWLRAAHGIDRTRVVLQKTPISFDAAQWEILAPAVGATVVVGGAGIHRDTERLVAAVKAHRVTTLQCVPTLLQALLETEELESCRTLEQVFTGGEALSRSLARSFLEALPGRELVNLYGPTECTINSSSFVVTKSSVGDGPNSVSIGTPVDGTEYRILGPDGAELGVGEIGELSIGGVQVARGYLHRPDLTEQRFTENPDGGGRFFRTGDLAHWNADGTVQFTGRADNQVKLRGFRVELDEIRLAIETHDWVRHAAVLVKDDPRTGFQNLIACVELDPREAALMDQGSHGAHHQSKESKLQVKAQLSNPGVRTAAELAGLPSVDLPGRTATEAQRALAFARKTYRFYEGEAPVSERDLLALLARRPASAGRSRPLAELDAGALGAILRNLGQHLSPERLLPKYAYASPGSLYATQVYLEITGFPGIRPGIHYHHPIDHRLVLVSPATPATPATTAPRLLPGPRRAPDDTAAAATPRIRMHFLGRRGAIEPVYRTNITEVLEIETGHIVGLLEEVLPAYGLDLGPAPFTPEVRSRLGVADQDHYLGSFDWTPWRGPREDRDLDLFVQVHPGKGVDLPAGQYLHEDGRLRLVSPDLVLRKQVIAINQAVYGRASFGVTVISRSPQRWRRYLDLGRVAQRLSLNGLDLGFMSSGYSSRGGDDLPSARRFDGILRELGRPGGASYFLLGGRVSREQRRHEGMREDAVHMRGPAELIRDDLVDYLPDYMIPNKVVVLDALPTTANGKIDLKALAVSDRVVAGPADRPFVAPRDETERRVAVLWQEVMKQESVSAQDDFFACGGNSLLAVTLVNRINRAFGAALPLEVVFTSPTVEGLARRLSGGPAERTSRLVPLTGAGSPAPTGTGSPGARPVFCWPGLGGYPMNLRLLAERLGTERPFLGVQAHGVNPGEVPYPTIREMAAEDVRALLEVQPEGPYTLWGYSFGARVAFETAYQLEQAGHPVDHVFLIAPGSPQVRTTGTRPEDRTASYSSRAFVAILLSVFTGTIDSPLLERCLEVARDDESFARFVGEGIPGLDPDLVRRIVRIVGTTFEFNYTFRELRERRVSAPITVFKARGDEYSFLDGSSGYSADPPTVVELTADHYSLLRAPDVDELVTAVHRRLHLRKDTVMPHVNIKHFPMELSDTRQAELLAAVTKAVTDAFGCDEGVVSIAVESVAEENWTEQVYIPEIVNRRDILGKVPDYRPDAL
ncbi:amino acid adenylation domain-containing protein [Kitasatospora purpeofusca]|uniref:amino acid adenylation domain-containing protein n=1 Tax=Kitasatospora purpeofusca TaxID=67352 RepID=UPI002A5AF799|nr:amino acid adenylation domain-containing protein [Kitasatospora purpeofusca]MDY0812453.1 amino acid adenylation domain-containing protein [Kitasatospora purpeofusca]